MSLCRHVFGFCVFRVLFFFGAGENAKGSFCHFLRTLTHGHAHVQTRVPIPKGVVLCISSQGAEPLAVGNILKVGEEGPRVGDDIQVSVTSAHDSSSQVAGRELPKEEVEGYDRDGELFLNTCSQCGETWLLPFEFGEDFVCEGAVPTCGPDASKAALSTFSTVGRTTRAQVVAMGQRESVLRQALAQHLTELDTSKLLLHHGLEPPQRGELEGLKARRRQEEAERASRREASREAGSKKPQRFLDGAPVEVQRGTKYVVQSKESTKRDRRRRAASLFWDLGRNRREIHRRRRKVPGHALEISSSPHRVALQFDTSAFQHGPSGKLNVCADPFGVVLACGVYRCGHSHDRRGGSAKVRWSSKPRITHAYSCAKAHPRHRDAVADTDVGGNRRHALLSTRTHQRTHTSCCQALEFEATVGSLSSLTRAIDRRGRPITVSGRPSC